MVKTAERISIFLFVVAVVVATLLALHIETCNSQKKDTRNIFKRTTEKQREKERRRKKTTHDKIGANVLALKMKVEYVNRLFIQHDYSLLFISSFHSFASLVLWNMDWI